MREKPTWNRHWQVHQSYLLVVSSECYTSHAFLDIDWNFKWHEWMPPSFIIKISSILSNLATIQINAHTEGSFLPHFFQVNFISKASNLVESQSELKKNLLKEFPESKLDSDLRGAFRWITSRETNRQHYPGLVSNLSPRASLLVYLIQLRVRFAEVETWS